MNIPIMKQKLAKESWGPICMKKLKYLRMQEKVKILHLEYFNDK